MKLTKMRKKTFVSRVMADVPKVDYAERAYDEVCTVLYGIMEKAVWYQHWAAKQNHNRFVVHNPDSITIIAPDGLAPIYVKIRAPEYVVGALNNQFLELWEKLVPLGIEAAAQRKVRKSLRSRLRGMIAGYETVKLAANALPELAKYLPLDRSAEDIGAASDMNELVADLVSAGWLKD